MWTFLILAALLCAVVLTLLLWPLTRRAERHPGNGVVLTVVALVPLASLLLYMLVGGGPEAIFYSQNPQMAMERDARADLEQRIAALRARLAEDDQDLAGWLLLARTLSNEGMLHESAEAFAQAMALGADGIPTALAQYADVIATLRGSLVGRPRVLAEQALALDPKHRQALWLAGSGAYQEGDLEQAKGYLIRLHALLEPGSREAEATANNIRTIRDELAVDGP